MNYILPNPTDSELADAIERSTGEALRALFSAFPTHQFYYCALVTSGEALAPALSAWSKEALKQASQDSGESEEDLKWSYSESPFFCFGDSYFDEVKQLFLQRPPITLDSVYWAVEQASRLAAMELAVSRLDAKGVFGVGARRKEIYVNVEVMPPDFSNVERALRLNPREAIVEWLQEEAELQP